MKEALLGLGMAFLVSGCASTIEAYHGRQVVEDQLITDDTGLHEIGTLAVTAQRRLIIGNLKTGNFCSEPPPEAADSITTALAAALKTNIAADKNVSAELASNFARHVNQLYKRAHTVQLFRDAAYHMCVNAVNSANGASGKYESYKDDVNTLVKDLVSSLDQEVTLYYETEKARAQNPPEVMQEMIICDSTATVDKKSDDGNNKLATSIICRPLSKMTEEKQEKKEELK